MLGNLDITYLYRGQDPDPRVETSSPKAGSPFEVAQGSLQASAWQDTGFSGYTKWITYYLTYARRKADGGQGSGDSVNYINEFGQPRPIPLQPAVNGYMNTKTKRTSNDSGF